MKAYVAIEVVDEERMTVVFAKSANKAKVLASNVLDVPYIKVNISRLPWADSLPHINGEIDWDNKEVAKEFRASGWGRGEGYSCDSCELYEWEILEDSHLVNGLCKDCREELEVV